MIESTEKSRDFLSPGNLKYDRIHMIDHLASVITEGLSKRYLSTVRPLLRRRDIEDSHTPRSMIAMYFQ